MPGPSSSPTVAVTNSDDVSTTSRWASSLPDDLVRLIASLLLSGDLLDDYVRFRAVCASWRSGTASPRGRGVVDPRFHPRRWMMLPEGNGLHPGHPKLQGYVRFFNLDTGAFVRVHIPLFQDHCVLDSIDGLLLLQRDHDTAIRLLHPFTGDIVDLPLLSTLVPQFGLTRKRMKTKLQYLRDLYAAASFVDGVVTVMLAFVPSQHVAVATPQDRQWTMSTWSCPASNRFWSSQGKIYGVYPAYEELCGPTADQIFQINTPLPDEPLQPPKLITTCNGVDRQHYGVMSFVECDSEILVIFYGYVSTLAKMLVYKLADLVAGRYIPVTSIGGNAIFIQRRSISASAKALPILKGDTITYIHYNFQFKGYLLEHHLSNDTRLPAMDHCSWHGIEPGPCSLIHHMITCCSRIHWNKGLLIGWKEWPYGKDLRWPMTAGGGGPAYAASRGVV